MQQRLGGGAAHVEAELQRLAGGGVDAVLVAGLGEQLPRALEIRLAEGVAVVLVVAEEAWRQRRLRQHAAAVGEQAQVLLGIDSEAHGLAQLAALVAGRRTDDRVLHVEADVEHRRLHLLVEADAASLHLRRKAAVDNDGIEALLDDAAVVVIALQELVEARDALLLAREPDLVEERQAAAGIGRVDALGVDVLLVDLGGEEGAGRIGWRGRAAIPGLVAREREAMLLLVEGEPERAGADRAIRQVGPPLLAVIVGHRLPGHGRGEGHGEPVEQLRVGRRQDELDLPVAAHHDALDAARRLVLLMHRQRRERGVGLAPLGEALTEGGKAEHIGEGARDRAVDGWIGKTGELEGDVRRRHLAGEAALLAQGKAWVAVEQDAGPQLEAIALLAVRQDLGLGDRLGEGRDQLVGPLQVVVLEQRVEDIADDDVLRRGVGDRRIERLGRLRERGVDNPLAAVRVGIGIVGAAAQGQERTREHCAKAHNECQPHGSHLTSQAAYMPPATRPINSATQDSRRSPSPRRPRAIPERATSPQRSRGRRGEGRGDGIPQRR